MEVWIISSSLSSHRRTSNRGSFQLSEFRKIKRSAIIIIIMKVVAIFAFLAVVGYASAFALPQLSYDGLMKDGEEAGLITDLEDVDTDGGLPKSSDLTPIRHRRVTCDLLSFSTPWGGVNHSACAARCLVQKHKGGACQNGVCVCRD